jgi:UDP-N-acetylglucosamine--N-acetylmuramyl-(pentapeptide) pyrophosphoryl-undecaprenol N-acetylglucosamine transferase
MEHELVAREGVPFVGIQAGGIHGVGLSQKLDSAIKLTRGFTDAMKIVGNFAPDVVLLTGGFVGVPVALAASLRRVPSVVFLPDIEPGMALSAMAKLATKVATTTQASAQFLPAQKHVVTGYPVREVFENASRDLNQARKIAREKFAIAPDEKVVLVFGGSKGARSINMAVLSSLNRLLPMATLIHVSGANDWDAVRAVREALPDSLKARYLAFPYLHEDMVDAMAAADVTVSRSGAVSLGELPLMQLPAVLVPYPHAWRYQKVNAQYLVDRQAAVIVEDQQLSDQLFDMLRTLLNAPTRLASMRTAMKSLAQSNGAQNIAAVMQEVMRHD